MTESPLKKIFGKFALELRSERIMYIPVGFAGFFYRYLEVDKDVFYPTRVVL